MPLDNLSIARVLGEIADLLELKGENPFKIRAYRNAADIVANSPEPAAGRSEDELRDWPGIGKDLSLRILEICDTGTCEHPPGALSPTSRRRCSICCGCRASVPRPSPCFYGELRIASLDDLEAAAQGGRLRALKGMGARKEQLLLRALEERKQHANRHLLAEAAEWRPRSSSICARHAPGVGLRRRRQPAARHRDLRRHRHPGVGRAGRRRWPRHR